MFRIKKVKLQNRITIFIVLLIMLIVLQVSVLFYYVLSDTIEKQLGRRALHVAETVAAMPEIREAFREEHPAVMIQPLVEKIRIETDAEFIVVGNASGIRYSHPNPARIGEKMVGGDNDAALVDGRSYTSKATGTLGLSLRGKAPIEDESGKVIGVVSVGFLMEDINKIVSDYDDNILAIAFLGALVGIVGSLYLARSIKGSMFGLEPEEIASLYEERNTVIQSVREGIMLIDKDGRIQLLNHAAYEILLIPVQQQVLGRHVLEIIPTTTILEVLETGEEQFDRQTELKGRTIITNRLPVKVGSEVIGVVSSFRLKSDIDQLTEELSQVRRYTEALRAQTHEFHNLLYTLSGLIQLESYEEAIELIHEETAVQQDFVQFIMKRLKDPRIGGILIGFYNRARELKVDFEIDRESSLETAIDYMDSSYFVSILGNLITNAFEAVEGNVEKEKSVRLFVTDIGDDLLIEVEDSGFGIEDQLLSSIFTRGFSTKAGGHRGYGLARIKELVEELRGSIAIEKGEKGGALFIIAIPKEGCEANVSSH